MKKTLALAFLSAVLLSSAYPRLGMWYVSWVALIPLFFAIDKKRSTQRFVAGFAFGVLFFSAILYWLVHVTVPGTIALILLLALMPAIFCLLCPFTIAHNAWSAILVPSAWVATEYLRTYICTGFPWALLGYSQSPNIYIIQIADITGVYGISFLVLLVNVGIYMVFRKVPHRFYVLFFIFVALSLVFAYGEKKLNLAYPTQKLQISVIQGNIPQERKWDPAYRDYIIHTHTALTEESLAGKPTLVIWPETSVPGYLEDEPDLKNRITGLAKSNNIYLLAGTLRETETGVFNSAVLISDKGEIITRYDKLHLVPFGEFIPFKTVFSWMREAVDKPIGDFKKGKEFTVFDFKIQNSIFGPDRIQKSTEFYKFATLICFEDIFPYLSRRFVQEGARFLVNITNDAWFGASSAPYQHMQGSIFRAVENRVPVIRAANTGISCIINHKGKVIKTVKAGKNEIFVDGYATGTITPVFSRTFYTRFGDVFCWICTAIALCGLFLKAIKRA